MLDASEREPERFRADNAYTLSVTRNASGYDDNLTLTSTLTRTFNFLAAEVSTYTRDITQQSNHRGVTSALATTMTVQKFTDLASDAELRLMHAKLKELGGQPPELDDIPGIEERKPQLRPANPKGLSQ